MRFKFGSSAMSYCSGVTNCGARKQIGRVRRKARRQVNSSNQVLIKRIWTISTNCSGITNCGWRRRVRRKTRRQVNSSNQVLMKGIWNISANC